MKSNLHYKHITIRHSLIGSKTPIFQSAIGMISISHTPYLTISPRRLQPLTDGTKNNFISPILLPLPLLLVLPILVTPRQMLIHLFRRPLHLPDMGFRSLNPPISTHPHSHQLPHHHSSYPGVSSHTRPTHAKAFLKSSTSPNTSFPPPLPRLQGPPVCEVINIITHPHASNTPRPPAYSIFAHSNLNSDSGNGRVVLRTKTPFVEFGLGRWWVV